MVKTKKMDEVRFAKLVKEFNALGELIRARQNEKQAVADEFDKEAARYKKGLISQKTILSSMEKSNKEFSKLDSELRKIISRANDFGTRAKKFASEQAPKTFRTELTGTKIPVVKKAKKKAKKKKAVKKVAKKTQGKKK